MQANIRNYADLIAEKSRLEKELEIKGGLIKKDISDIKEELKPLGKVMSIVGKLTSLEKLNPLVGIGLGLAGDLLFKKLLFGSSGVLTRLIGPLVAKGFTSKLFSNGNGLMHTLGEKLHTVTNFFKRLPKVVNGIVR
jgi:hypothetical protein